MLLAAVVHVGVQCRRQIRGHESSRSSVSLSAFSDTSTSSFATGGSTVSACCLSALCLQTPLHSLQPPFPFVPTVRRCCDVLALWISQLPSQPTERPAVPTQQNIAALFLCLSHEPVKNSPAAPLALAHGGVTRLRETATSTTTTLAFHRRPRRYAHRRRLSFARPRCLL